MTLRLRPEAIERAVEKMNAGTDEDGAAVIAELSDDELLEDVSDG